MIRISALALLALAACDGGEKTCSEGFILGADGNCYATEGDTDTDTDADTDTDTDADTDTDTDTDPVAEQVSLSGTFTVSGATPADTSICIVQVFGGTSYDEGASMPREGEVPIAAIDVTCPTGADEPSAWTAATVPITGQAKLGLFGFIDINGDAGENPEGDIGGAPYPGNTFDVAPGDDIGDIAIVVTVGGPPPE